MGVTADFRLGPDAESFFDIEHRASHADGYFISHYKTHGAGQLKRRNDHERKRDVISEHLAASSCLEGLCADSRQVLGEPRNRARRLEGICGRVVCPAS